MRQVTGINVVYLILTAEELHHHCVVLVVLRHADVDPLVVRGAIGVVEGVRNVGARLRIVSAELLSANTDVRCEDGGSIEVGYNLVAHAGAGAVEQSSTDTASQHACSVVVAECLRSDSRRLILLTENVGNATTSSPAYCVITRRILLGAEFAIAAHLSPDQVRELSMDGFPVEAELLQSLIAQVNNENVSISKKLLHELHAVLVLEVDGNEVLVGVVQVERRIFVVVLFATEARTLGALSVAVQGLGLDDGSAHFGQAAYCSRSGNPFAEFYNFDACERAEAVEFICSGHTDCSPSIITNP